MGLDIREKRVNEKYSVGFNFAAELATGETIASATATVTTGLTKTGDPTISGSYVSQFIEGGTVGNYYGVTLKATSSAGNVFEKVFIIRLIADVLPAVAGANALVRLDEAKSYIGKVTDEDTAMIEQLIDSVSIQFNSLMNRTLVSTTYTNLYLDGNGQQILYLPNWPITNLASVYEDDILLTVTDDYLLYGDEGYIWRVGSVWSKGAKTIKVTYTAGYVCLTGTITLPADIRLRALKRIAFEFSRYLKKDWGESSRGFPDGSISISEEEFRKEEEASLWKYRKLK